MADKFIALFKQAYPEITSLTNEDLKPEKYYATYSLGLFFDDKECIYQPCDFRHVGLHRTAGYILGVDPTEVPPDIKLADDSRPVPEPYVCIGVQSTAPAKDWNNPMGWHEIVPFLKEAGHPANATGHKPMQGTGLYSHPMPTRRTPHNCR